MGHISGKDVYRRLGKKIDQLPTRAPWNASLHAILKELYTPEEADVIVRMPYGFSTLARIARITKYDRALLDKILPGLCGKGLVLDIFVKGEYYYSPCPLVVGIFELTMMRTGGNLNTKEWARLFHEYFHESESIFSANFHPGDKISLMRALPYAESIKRPDYVEILDYERVEEIVNSSNRCAIGICSCRHEKLHLGLQECATPLETCSMFGFAADYMIRHKLAKEVSQSEMLGNVARSKELGLVFNADNVQQNVSFICHCCKCCCNVLLGVSKFGCPETIVTSNFISEVDDNRCSGCGKCAKACPVDAIAMLPQEGQQSKKTMSPRIDKTFCLGCGVCALACAPKAIGLVKRKKRVLHPETTFARVMLYALERGTLQNQLFDDPSSITQDFLRAFLGGFLNLQPVKRALVSDALRSSFLGALKKGARSRGKEWATDI
jgi:Pyruvate/2-oxoacid:ferredoxin oxidoreductase delta subunit